MAEGLLSGDLHSIVNAIAAIGALGTAAFGLVDASKGLAGGISRRGFGFVEEAVRPLLPAEAAGEARFGAEAVRQTLFANWLNGKPLPEQKAAAKSLIRLGLTPQTAPRLAAACGVDADLLTDIARRIAGGQALQPEHVNVLGRFDAVLSAILDRGYERADQSYRNSAKLLALVFSLLLALWAGALIHDDTRGGYLFSWDFALAIIVGFVATPLAPVAKDLASSLAAAAGALRAGRR